MTEKPRILVDLLGFNGMRGGTETYAKRLVPLIAQRMPSADWIALANPAGADAVSAFFPGDVRVRPSSGSGSARWAFDEIFHAERVARRVDANLMWCPANFGPVISGRTRVVTVHDVIYDEVRGGIREAPFRVATSLLMKRAARSADRVIAISHATARAVKDRFGIEDDRIDVVHNGATAQNLSGAVVRPTFLDASDRRPLLLSTGNRMPHKNFEGILHALATMKPSERPIAIIPGSHGDDPLRSEVARLGLERDVILPGWITHEELESLYALASVYVCPSLAEGFGLPVVDALRRGLGVIANDIPVLREVGGTVTRYVDAQSPTLLAEAITAELAQGRSQEQRSARVAWSEKFSWDAAADGVTKSLRSALRPSGSA